MLTTNTFAQDQESFAGYYCASGPAYLLLDEDHHFYIIAYATFIQGRWSRENDAIKLVPQNPEHTFELYARYNPNIKEGYKIKFNGFEKNQTFIGIAGTDTMQRVFNLNPSCFANQYINHFPSTADSISFADALDPESSNENSERKNYTFRAGKYNDFIAVYHDPSNYQREMTLLIEQKSGQLTLKGEADQFEKHEMGEELQRELVEIRDMGKKSISVNTFYCNPSYRPFDNSSLNFEDNYSFDEDNYSFDTAKNAWVSKYNYEKDEEIYPERKDDAYDSIGILYKYEKITPTNIAFKPFEINEKSLFTA